MRKKRNPDAITKTLAVWQPRCHSVQSAKVLSLTSPRERHTTRMYIYARVWCLSRGRRSLPKSPTPPYHPRYPDNPHTPQRYHQKLARYSRGTPSIFSKLTLVVQKFSEDCNRSGQTGRLAAVDPLPRVGGSKARLSDASHALRFRHPRVPR
jgi:hypothetical protein